MRPQAHLGDGSPLASFLCPVCYHDVLLEDVGCEHVLLIRDRHGEIYSRDRRIRLLHREAVEQTGDPGIRAIERLCERLGPSAVLYELLGDTRSGSRESSTIFVVDTGSRQAT